MLDTLLKHHTIARDYRDAIFIDEIRYTKTTFYKEAIDRLNLSDQDKYKALKDITLFDQILSKAQTVKQAEKSETFEEFDKLFTVYSIQDEHNSKDGYVVYDKQKDSFGTVVYAHLFRLYGKSFMETLPKVTASHVYNPLMRDNKSKIKELGDGSYEINTYEVPSWQERYYKDSLEAPVASLPPLMDKFLHHLFPLKEVRSYVFRWIYYAMTSKRGNIETLVLQGLPGTGKSIFAEVVLRYLFGGAPSGYLKSPKSALGKFQAALIRRRLVVMDEFKITYQTYDAFKMLTNDKLTFEKKGVDADKEYDKHYSLVATLNEVRDWYITQDDRRSSILELTDKKLEDEWSLSEIDELLRLCREDEDFIYQTGAYILSKSWLEGDLTPLRQYRSKKFYDFVYESLSQWKKDFIEHVFLTISKDEDHISLTNYCRKMEKKKPVGIRTLESFIKEYLHEGKHSLGEVRLDDEEDNKIIAERILYINPVLLGDKSE